MQYKKDRMKEKLLQAGEDEFFTKGFKGASVRSISRSAGTTLGNFYNYFTDKVDLFQKITGDEMGRFIEFMGMHDESKGIQDQEEPSIWNEILLEYAEAYISVFTRRFYILMACSEGTGFEESRKDVVRYIKEHFILHVMENGSIIDEMDTTAEMLANEFLYGILYILKNHGNGETAVGLMRNHMLFFWAGTTGLLKANTEGDQR